MRDVWIWVRVPLRGLERAIESLKERVARRHAEASEMREPEKEKRLREDADQDDVDAETLRQAIRDETERPPDRSEP